MPMSYSCEPRPNEFKKEIKKIKSNTPKKTTRWFYFLMVLIGCAIGAPKFFIIVIPIAVIYFLVCLFRYLYLLDYPNHKKAKEDEVKQEENTYSDELKPNKFKKEIKSIKWDSIVWTAFSILYGFIIVIKPYLFLTSIPILFFAWKVNDEKKEMQEETQNEIASQSYNIVDEFWRNEKVLFLSSFKYENDSVLNFLESKIEIEDENTNSLLKFFIKRNLQDYVPQKQNETQEDISDGLREGEVEVKSNLLNDYNVDLALIDKEISILNQQFKLNCLQYLGKELKTASVRYSKKTEIKEEMEDELYNINEHYSNMIEESSNILEFGTSYIEDFDLEEDISRIENTSKYYPDFAEKVDFNLNEFEERYNAEDKTAVEFFNNRVLKNSIYPSFVSKEFEIHYSPENKMLVLDYNLPNIDDIPKIKEINFVSTKSTFKEVLLSPKEQNELYDKILYQIALRSNYELFFNDKVDAIDTIVFNGWVRYIDKADGISKTACVMSMQASKKEFMGVNLSNVEPRACFKKFKGVGSSALHSITPINPILIINKEDKRFVASYEVMNQIEEGDNLASMDWQDFENLIREIFEKEFSQNGGEVKVTQSSRDGGVDAIAFDPDPIRGGKIVIQAKRYTNIVGVSAVRDLYGTTMNEGATKGILVTTSDYGADSYEFAKGKPLTLLNGGHLLHLLEKHGHKARINLQEAKECMKQ